MSVQPFTIKIDDAVLDDLAGRIDRTRWAADFANGDWAYGAEAGYLHELVAYWRTGYDWRRHEALMNRFAHFKTELDGIPIHFVHERGKGPAPMPLILTHGWPWTFWDWQKVIGPLTDPASFGGDPADAFDIVAPDLPGFGFSSPLRRPGVDALMTADLWQRLMNDVLGYGRFGAHGGDWGAFVTAQLGHKHADRLIGIHLANGAPLDFFQTGLPGPDEYAPDEAGLRGRTVHFFAQGHGYSAIQSTRPQTLAYGLTDSPVGLAAWLVEKRRDWSDCGGLVERCHSKDDLLTSVMIYWVTQTIGTSARYYYEGAQNPWKPSHGGMPVVDTPTGIIRFDNDVCYFPRKVMERHYDIRRWTRVATGGHFAPMEQPDILVDDLRAFFRQLRRSAG
jgi:pimeloyl-ACP methyl ester carboxylesterase